MFAKRLEKKLDAMLATQGELMDLVGKLKAEREQARALKRQLGQILDDQRTICKMLTALEEGQSSILAALEQKPLGDKLQEGIEAIMSYDGPKGRGQS